MSRRDSILLGFATLLVAVYVFFFTDWLKRSAITIRQAAPRVASVGANRAAYPAVFDLMTK